MEVFLSLYVCPQVVLLDKSNIALFAFRFSFGDIGDRSNNLSDHPFTEVVLFLHKCP